MDSMLMQSCGAIGVGAVKFTILREMAGAGISAMDHLERVWLFCIINIHWWARICMAMRHWIGLMSNWFL